MPTTYQLGPWTFVPSNQELVAGETRVRLEHRSARALELLCERRGRTVSQADLSSHLWGERQVSANSLPVIVRDLRRALRDDARNPVYLETVAKSGYRLLPPQPGAATAPPPRRAAPAWLIAAATVLITASAAIATWQWQANAAPPPTLLLIGDLPNATGNPAYNPLALASQELLFADLGKRPQFRLRHASAAVAPLPSGRVLRFSSKLVLWSGQPDVVFVAEDVRTAEIVWSGYAFGAEATLPHKVEAKLAEFAAAVAPKP